MQKQLYRAPEGYNSTNRQLKRIKRVFVGSEKHLPQASAAASNDLQEAQVKLLEIMRSRAAWRSNETSNQILKDATASWYLAFLNAKLLSLDVHGVGQDWSVAVRASFYELLCIAASCLKDWKDVSLHAIVDEVKDNIGESSKILLPWVDQLTFSAIGWLTMLYSPNVEFKGGFISIAGTSDGFGNNLPSQVIECSTIPLGENSYLPVQSMLRLFGEVIPESQPLQPERTSVKMSLYSQVIVVSNVAYHSLIKVAKVEIEWVDCLCMHLEFNEKSGRLKLFRFPSFCKLICSKRGDGRQYLESFFAEAAARANTDHAMQRVWHNIYEEVLLSYRILFGQDGKSRSLIKRDFAGPSKPIVHEDPFLLELCTMDAKKQAIYKEPWVPAAKDMYFANSDFPLLGQRLIELQAYVIAQNPSDLWTLWHDRRDLSRFYTFWAVVIIGGLSVILSFLQVILSALQVSTIAWH